MRGKRIGRARPAGPPRIIPARAGQTSRAPTPKTRTTDHPRACGANFEKTRLRMINPGSSPRVRGKLVAVDQADDRVRIIPARAGQTNRVRTYNRHTADHPRACGANALAGDPHNWKDGSSPRVRGKRLPWRSGTGRISDHPRACGANGIECAHRTCRHGSSPRVRGKRYRMCSSNVPTRIIPARAGQTAAAAASPWAWPDHPRACGANHSGTLVHSEGGGSSPRVRGKLPRVT